jgi:two-component system, OmpR family, phosphate regulon sensor histidine kinase PhoR
MIGRWAFFLGCMAVGGAIGSWAHTLDGVWFGAVCGAVVWFAFDSTQSARLLHWLRSEQARDLPTISPSSPPALRGAWGEVADRARRLLRSRGEQYQDIRMRLEEFLAAMQASPNGVVLLDAQGRIEWSNHMATTHFGFDAQRDVMQHIVNLVREPAFKAYLASGRYAEDVVIPGHFTTASRPVKLSVHLHTYGQGRKLLLSRDVTAVELAEAMRRDFVANVSHEIRTPLTVLSGFIETLQTLPLKEADRTRYLGLMSQQSERMQTLVNDLLTLSRLEGSPLPGFPGTGDWIPMPALMAQCEQEARALSQVITPGCRQLHFLSSSPACELAGVQAEIYSAMSNLVTNAVRYTPESGSIHVSWRLLTDGRGEFTVKDTGPGIAPEHLPRLTERFYRIDRSRSRETGGTGLGLAIVKHVAQRHGAELQIRSQLGKGAEFSLIFPSARVRLQSTATQDEPSHATAVL